MARRGKKRQLEVEARYRALLQSGVGTAVKRELARVHQELQAWRALSESTLY